jgi:hypothetical protein
MKSLTKETEALFGFMSKAYLERVEKGVNRSEAVEMGSVFDVQDEFLPTLEIEDVYALCEELEKAGFLTLSLKLDGGNNFGESQITPSGIITIESEFGNDLKKVSEFLKALKPFVEFLKLLI